MDKPKILIVGADPSSASLARLLGIALHEHAIQIVETEKELLNADYSALEKRVLFHHSQFDRIPEVGKRPDLIIYDDFGLPKAADHPSRKREPKGPRGKWGKPK